MPPSRHLWRISAYVTLATGFAVAHTDPPAKNSPTDPLAISTLFVEQTSWINQLWQLPFLQIFSPAMTAFELPTLSLAPEPARPPACLVEPLPVIENAAALDFERNVGSPAVVNTDGLTPTTARALARFEKIVTSAGGLFAITSAYRPFAYQEHLQAVWDKWMLELRDNDQDGCRDLKTEVQIEFTRHQLLETQRPVPLSDHTLGVGFDAWVKLPNRSRQKGRRFSLDGLARRAGVQRPAVARDPVHFRLIGGRILGS